ncbi:MULTISPECIES: DUF362 domain-containing protein [unclassified Pseudodesulfovibrio]|uniref:DUF362 domain-containing protein n=1 Tax=unclassified Pseudodesulfovibrio TaxID=2661612 RepID=UPI000FEBFD82|nr:MULTISPECIES: DUF362 domain-containing protein [unclassified Pseudodesulfovibrio]MCJ2166216.1 DUF362 domain-containing protein [Pseudodesulfovibrio sp. S3-i]RWU02322.1 DUF362 domain-containing protein [Pseudodesulfovibrio sp. S3]
MNEQVAIARILEYESTLLDRATALLLEDSGFRPNPGDRVLIKPNLVNGSNARHCTTHPLVVRAACVYLLECGARVTVADSPAFGPAAYVARNSGLGKAMNGLGLKVHSLKNAVPLALSKGGTVGISRDALEADHILNIPKLKVHCQMTISGAVKNLFGCVVGFRKALAHNRLGHSHELFRSMLMDVYAALPRAVHFMDGIHPLHKDGPINGVPFPLGLLAASNNGIALDTAVYALLGLTPARVPLWAEAATRNMSGTDPAGIGYPLEQPGLFDTTGFELSPKRELSFAPMRLVKGRIRSLLKHFAKS